jgi:hypothetical protein
VLDKEPEDIETRRLREGGKGRDCSCVIHASSITDIIYPVNLRFDESVRTLLGILAKLARIDP